MTSSASHWRGVFKRRSRLTHIGMQLEQSIGFLGARKSLRGRRGCQGGRWLSPKWVISVCLNITKAEWRISCHDMILWENKWSRTKVISTAWIFWLHLRRWMTECNQRLLVKEAYAVWWNIIKWGKEQGEEMKRNVTFPMHPLTNPIAGEPHLIPSQDSIKDSCEDVTALETFTQQQVQQQQSLPSAFHSSAWKVSPLIYT